MFLVERYGVLLKKEETRLRRPVPYQKRFAILLHWLAHLLMFAQVAALYGIAKSTAVAIVHEGVSITYQSRIRSRLSLVIRTTATNISPL